MLAASFKGRWALILALALGALLQGGNAHALPAYARQTGQECIACHISFPELTPYGRYFKLTGYTIGQRQLVPLAMMAQIGVTSISNNTMDDGSGASVINRNNNPLFSGASIFLAGKATDFLGAFIQYTYDNASNPSNPAEHLVGHSGMDNADIRLVGKSYGVDAQEVEYIYGFTMNNNPTVQDVWNSTPAFGFPYTTSPLAPTPGAATLIDGGLAQQVAGYGVYAFLKKTVYAEFSFYQTADGMFSWMRHGQPSNESGGVNRLQNVNPYYRVALTHDWGPHSAMVGSYGMQAKVYADNLDPGSGTNKFTDYAFDAQYQYITIPHVFTSQWTYIHEKQNWDANFPAGSTSNDVDYLKTWKGKVTYYYQRKYGATFQYFNTTGTIDPLLYPAGEPINGFLNGSPNSRGQIYELDFVPIQNVRLMLQYTAYNKFNGGDTNYDGFGRKASDNNTLFLNLWFAY
ncbi:MAG TPA: cytochrome C [Burkholderiales bacterium]|nr:cytochrome C [Burkholderiales bacterium]